MEAVASLRHSTICTTHTIVIPGSLQPLQVCERLSFSCTSARLSLIETCHLSTLWPSLRSPSPQQVQTVAVLMKKTVFEASSVVEHTSAVLNSLPANVFLDKGDLLVLSVTDVYGQPYLIVSFRGEDNGREVIALLDALHALLVTMPKHRLILGLDADTRAIACKYEPSTCCASCEPRTKCYNTHAQAAYPSRDLATESGYQSRTWPLISSPEVTPHAGATTPTPPRTRCTTRERTCRSCHSPTVARPAPQWAFAPPLV